MTSLHTRYRPKTLKEVIGQQAVTNSLAKVLEKKSSNTFLLVGPSGVGKTTIARIAAKTVGCKRPDEINAAKYTGIDDMRSVTDSLGYKPFEGGTRAIIIDECHQLSKQAWNSLLKDTEEPPEWVYWFLCTTEVGKVPANIKTRCTTYNLKPVNVEPLEQLLEMIIEKEKLGTNPKIRKLCAEEAQGSPRQAIVNLEVCSDIKNIDEAKELLQSASESPQAIDLARALMKRADWKDIQKLLREMKDINPESVRHVVLAYFNSIALSTNQDQAGRAIEIIDAFSNPFIGSGITPITLACGRALLS